LASYEGIHEDVEDAVEEAGQVGDLGVFLGVPGWYLNVCTLRKADKKGAWSW
jgi:hypothetical protein